jgi:hypothetical protein
MPITVSDIDTLQEYIQGVVGKAEHHARGVDEIVFAVAGMIVWRKDADRELQVHERDGKMTNVLWVWISGERYAFSYDRDHKAIAIRRGSTHGDKLAIFDNDTPVSEIKQFFAGL